MTHHGDGDDEEDDADDAGRACPVVGQAGQDAADDAAHVEQRRQVGRLAGTVAGCGAEITTVRRRADDHAGIIS